MAHRVSPQAVADLDDIWYYVAKESGSIETANHLIDSITIGSFYFPDIHTLAVLGVKILGVGFGVSLLASTGSFIASRAAMY